MPMNPEWLPVMAILLAGIFAGVMALRALFSRRVRRALALGAASFLMIAVTLVLGRPQLPPEEIRPLTPGAPPTIRPSEDDSDTSAMSLVLGSVALRVPPSDRYVLALDGRKFLGLVRTRRGLRVNCDAGTLEGGVVVHLRDNRFLYPTWPEGKANRPDAHTFAVQDPKRMDFLRVRFADPHRIEVMGVFFTGGQRDTVEIRDQGGIRWPGGGAPPGMTMDLRPFGNGTIDFERSGRIRVLR